MGKEKKVQMNKKIILAGGVVIGLIILAVTVGVVMSAGYTIDLSKVYEIKYDGLNGEGKAEIVINEQEQDVIAEELEVYAETPDVMEKFLDIEYEIVSNENLSNGDTIKVVAKYSESFFEKYKIEIKDAEEEFLVKGLVVPQEIDVFDGLRINCEGISPFIKCTLDTTDCGEFVREYVDFDTTKNYYNSGEKIEVMATYDEEDAIQEKVKVVKEEAEYKAESKEYYVDSVEKIDLATLQSAFDEKLKLEYASADDLFCGVELGWTNHYTGVKEEQKKGEFCMVLREVTDFDEETPYNIYGIYYRVKIGVEHRSRGNEGTFDTEIDVLLIATNLYMDENNVLHYDELIEVKAEEVDGASDLMSKYIKENDNIYKAK